MNNHYKMPRTLLVLCLLFAAARSFADDALDGELEIRSAYAVPSHGTVLLSAHVLYPQSEPISAALRDGVTLSFDLEVMVSRHRRLWFDADAVDLTRRRELSYHAISERFLLRDIEANSQESFPTLAAALARLGQVEEWPIAVDAQLHNDDEWQIRLRAGVRRGHMPDALRALMFWSDGWHRTSDWYSWTLVR
jgi:Domain of unknown function (DUF4390)